MRLAEAIRLGSMLAPQGFGIIMDAHMHTCAVGAAFQASGHEGLEEFEDYYDLTLAGDRVFTCPQCQRRAYDLGRLIAMHLNDHHRWTREAIADWLDTLVPVKQVETPTPAEVEELVEV